MESVLGQGSGGKPAGSSVSSGGAGFPGRLLLLEDPLMRGEDVRAWQAQMRQRGWRGLDGQPLDADGWFGEDSWRAARLFQEEKGLTIDGVVGQGTWEATFAR
jgi:peptidoglycan hydrolase-like protein with peptidoglycan-binding domain